jgi:hypothetical protein
MTDKITMFNMLFADGAAERQLDDPMHLHIFRCSVLVRLLLVLEYHNANTGTPEQDALREIRNAVVHNAGDLAKNRNPHSLSLVQGYLSDLTSGKVPSMHTEPLKPFFSLHGSSVRFDAGGISEHCRQVFMKYVP